MSVEVPGGTILQFKEAPSPYLIFIKIEVPYKINQRGQPRAYFALSGNLIGVQVRYGQVKKGIGAWNNIHNTMPYFSTNINARVVLIMQYKVALPKSRLLLILVSPRIGLEPSPLFCCSR